MYRSLSNIWAADGFIVWVISANARRASVSLLQAAVKHVSRSVRLSWLGTVAPTPTSPGVSLLDISLTESSVLTAVESS